MMCFQFDGFVCDKTSQDFAKVHSWARASWLQPIRENQMGVHPYFEGEISIGFRKFNFKSFNFTRNNSEVHDMNSI